MDDRAVEGFVEERRRRVPRQEAGWPGYCGLDDTPELAWFECRVLDISILGAGIEIYQPAHPISDAGVDVFGPEGEDLAGHKITVDAQSAGGGQIRIRFTGLVRNVRPGAQGVSRIGIEFLGLSDTERKMLDTLERMKTVW